MQLAVSKISKGNRLVEFNCAQVFQKGWCTLHTLHISDFLKKILEKMNNEYTKLL